MRITIDAVPLLIPSAGVKNYLYYWIRHLIAQSGTHEIGLFPLLRKLPPLKHQGSGLSLAGTWARFLGLRLLNEWRMDGLLAPADVFHSSKLLNPPRRAKLTATIHDLTCWLLPDTHFPANVSAEKAFAERVLKHADGIIAVSEHTRRDAVEVLGISPEKIRVIHHGVSEAFFSPASHIVECARALYALAKPYVLFVGTIEPRKNILMLLAAWESLPPDMREEHELILAGPIGWIDDSTRARLRALPPGVRFLGYVQEDILPGLFGGARAFVYPSLYEGFGFPAAQAMAAGVPVVTSSVSALPEVTGGAALLVDPHSEESLRRALRDVLTSPTLREDLACRGRERARDFSWIRNARRSLAFFEEVAGRC